MNLKVTYHGVTIAISITGGWVPNATEWTRLLA